MEQIFSYIFLDFQGQIDRITLHIATTQSLKPTYFYLLLSTRFSFTILEVTPKTTYSLEEKNIARTKMLQTWTLVKINDLSIFNKQNHFLSKNKCDLPSALCYFPHILILQYCYNQIFILIQILHQEYIVRGASNLLNSAQIL